MSTFTLSLRVATAFSDQLPGGREFSRVHVTPFGDLRVWNNAILLMTVYQLQTVQTENISVKEYRPEPSLDSELFFLHTHSEPMGLN